MADYIHHALARLAAATGAVLLCFALSACSDNMFNNGFNPFGTHKGAKSSGSSAQVSALEGRWTDSNNISSTFHNGVFETRSPDTNEKLSEGNYSLSPNGIIAIEMRSLVRGTVSHVNCSIAQTKLYCTTENNAKFTLAKK